MKKSYPTYLSLISELTIGHSVYRTYFFVPEPKPMVVGLYVHLLNPEQGQAEFMANKVSITEERLSLK
jgi:hypothetical protein